MSKISIALCTYNGAEHLALQLESYLAQARLPEELVVCDDSSQDETVRILQDYACRMPFTVRIYVNDKNLGTTENFEKAISLCSGDVILLSDQDDVWMPSKIEKIVKVFDHNPEIGFVFSNAQLVDDSLRPLEQTLWDITFTPEDRDVANECGLFRLLKKRNVVTGATLAFRAEFKSVIAPIPDNIPNVVHDCWIAMILSIVTGVKWMDDLLVKYRQHVGQQLGLRDRLHSPRILNVSWREALEIVVRNHSFRKEYLLLLRDAISPRPGVPKELVCEIDEEIECKSQLIKHYEHRRDFPASFMYRIRPIIREVLSGRYHRFSRGIRSAMRDLFVDNGKIVEISEELPV